MWQSFIGALRYSMPSDHTQAYDQVTAPTAALTTMVTGKTMPLSLGKRNREKYETYSYGLPQANDEDSDENEPGPQKRARPNATRVPGEAQSSKRTRRSPATMTRKTINSK